MDTTSQETGAYNPISRSSSVAFELPDFSRGKSLEPVIEGSSKAADKKDSPVNIFIQCEQFKNSWIAEHKANEDLKAELNAQRELVKDLQRNEEKRQQAFENQMKSLQNTEAQYSRYVSMTAQSRPEVTRQGATHDFDEEMEVSQGSERPTRQQSKRASSGREEGYEIKKPRVREPERQTIGSAANTMPQFSGAMGPPVRDQLATSRLAMTPQLHATTFTPTPVQEARLRDALERVAKFERLASTLHQSLIKRNGEYDDLKRENQKVEDTLTWYIEHMNGGGDDN